jgi:hypothetical protein
LGQGRFRHSLDQFEAGAAMVATLTRIDGLIGISRHILLLKIKDNTYLPVVKGKDVIV